MKILVISAEYPPFFAGGIALNVFDMNNHMNKKNDVITLTFGNNNDTIISEEKETKVISFPIPVEKKELTYEQKYIVQNQNIIANIDKYENILVNASLIILHGYFMSKLALYISKRYNIPILYYLHVMYTEKIENLLDTISKDELKILKKAKGIVSVSGYLLEKANGIYPIMKKSIVIGKYVDIQNTFSIKSSENNKLYLYVGRMSEEKGIEILLYAFKKYIECNNQDAVLYCIGNFVDEEYENKIKKICNSCKQLKRQTVFLGNKSRNDIYKYMRISNAVIIPSYMETFGKVAIEAMANETIVIAANVGGLGPLIIDGKTGLKFEAGDSEDLYRQLCKLQNINRNEIVNMGYQFVKEEFSFENIKLKSNKFIFDKFNIENFYE